MKDGKGKIALTVCGDPKNVVLFVNALRKQTHPKKQSPIGNIQLVDISFQNIGETPYCETGSIIFKKAKKVKR